VGRKVVLQREAQLLALDKSGGVLTSEIRGRSQAKKDRRARRTAASYTVHQAKVEAITELFTSSPIKRAHAPKSDAKDDLTKSE
jgi:hypothetical protein